MKSFSGTSALVGLLLALFAPFLSPSYGDPPHLLPAGRPAQVRPPTYLGFDSNPYPGDEALPSLRKAFVFTGYWLNNPPGERSNSWRGHRAAVAANGFGFLVLFNGRLIRELSKSDPRALGARDAAAAVAAAKAEGFRAGTVIFLDQEEGGRLLPEQRAYLHAWIDAVNTSGYLAGVYCSGIAAEEEKGVFVVTASDLRTNSEGRKIVFFVYNDACPPSPGCALSQDPPPPSASGIPFAEVWQFAQSPRRKVYTRSCAAQYAKDGNCYPPPGSAAPRLLLDLNSATSQDPSRTR